MKFLKTWVIRIIEAIYMIENKYSMDFSVLVIGEVSLKNEYEKLVNGLSLVDSIKFPGIRQDVIDLMKHSKIFVLHSCWEGLLMVILEAMESCIPIVAIKVGGIPEVIKDCVNGFFVCTESPTELVVKIVHLLNNSLYGQELSKNAFGKVKEEYSIEA